MSITNLFRIWKNDTALRVDRIKSGKAKRYLLTVGGAGAQKRYSRRVIETLLPRSKAGKATAFPFNVGDHKKRLGGLLNEIPAHLLRLYAVRKRLLRRVRIRRTGSQWRRKRHLRVLPRRYFIAAVYITNLLIRACDVLVTKPSELSFIPCPNCLSTVSAGHEAYGALRSAEVGDGNIPNVKPRVRPPI